MQHPNQPGPIHTEADLPPRDLVDAVTPRRPIGRLTVGTGPFNAAAMVVLVAISTFVVMASGTVPGTGAIRADASPEQAHGPQRIPNRMAYADEPTPTTTTTTTTTTSTSTVPTTAPPVSTTTTTPPKPRARLAATAATPTIRCSLFTTQPDAQRWFDAARATSAALDGDGDGLACEDLPGRPSTTTPPPATAPVRTVQGTASPPLHPPLRCPHPSGPSRKRGRLVRSRRRQVTQHGHVLQDLR